MSKKSTTQYSITWIWHGRGSSVGLPINKGARAPDSVRIPVEIGVHSEWVSTAQIAPGPTHLAALPFKYTMEVHEQVFATNDRTADKEWYLKPAYEGTYLIGIDKQMTAVWTVVDNKIMITPVDPDYYGQMFQISAD